MNLHAVVRQVFRAAGVTGLALGVPAAAQAQRGGGDGFLFKPPAVSFNFRFGYDRATAGSDLFTFITTQHTVDQGDFSSFVFEGDLGIRITNRFDLVLGAGYSRSEMPSEFREFIDNNDQPIEQVTEFQRIPVTASVKFYLTPRGHRVGQFAWVPARFAPYVGAGGGAIKYDLVQEGDFISFATMAVFADTFQSHGTVPAAQVYGGIDWALGTHVALTGEARYTWAKADLSGDYIGFEQLDLSGVALTAGVSFRF